MKSFQLYGFCLIVSASLVALLSMSTDFFVSWVNDIVIPCQHDSVWTGTGCNCDNTRGVYGGTYCDECQCKHQGICGVLANGNSRYGCRCPSHTKWTGTLCDKCYSENKDESLNRCSGPCLNTSTHQHFGPKCDTVCIAGGSSADDVCREISSGGGVCNACNGHGACTATGQCECDEGWFNTIGGEQCALTCSDVDIDCNPDTGVCQSVGGQLQCVCQPGYYGKNCDLTCNSVNELTCSGHGTCSLTALGVPACTCETHYVGDMCQYECPGDKTFPTSCSGHGECFVKDDAAVCECDASTSWTGVDCSCNAKFTCSGHGTCNSDATCNCNNFTTPTHQHWAGSSCQKCQEHWYGQECHLHCDPDGKYIPDEFSQRSVSNVRDGFDIGCNGFGTCELFKTSVGERVKCSCRGTDPSWFCSKCEANYYPLTSVSTADAFCTTECNAGTCSYRGVCNDAYDGSNDLCICDKRTVGNVTFDTVDPKRFCSVCKENWYPGEMDSYNACTHYCAEDGYIENRLIVFGDEKDRTLEGDVNAQKVCSREGDGYSPDPDCRVCSGHGTCRNDGECECDDSRTGIYCEIDCGASANGQVCSGHGRCVRNDLDMWFDPFTTEYRCECLPYDTYTAETRQRLIKSGVSVEPPPSPNFYGRYCEFHCPRYNEAICAGRGECKTGIATAETGPDIGKARDCSTDMDCADIPGAFCAQLSSPWDSLMSGSRSFFSSGPESPGYFTCATSQNCVDSIYSIAWDDYCVSMLNGWYPNVLNTATCTYHSNNQTNCREIVEDYFIDEHSKFDDKTWCHAAMDELSPLSCTTKSCDESSTDECCLAKAKCSKPADQDIFDFNERMCITWELEAACAAEPSCVYDKTYSYMEQIDNYCLGLTIENEKCLIRTENGVSIYADQCKPKFDGSACEAKTYCRAKRCEDAILENNIESLCVNVEPACKTPTDTEWADVCTTLTGELREYSDLSVKDTFFSCVMYKNSANPQTVSAKIPGDASIYGEIALRYGDQSATEDIPIQTFRQQFLESVILLDGSQCSQDLSSIDFSQNKWCEEHLKHVIPSWTSSLEPRTNWFQEYMVYCSSGIESLWTYSADADNRIQELSKDCTVQFRCKNRENTGWDGVCPESDSESVHETPWLLECLNAPSISMEKLDWSTFPEDVSSCVLKERALVSRWGNNKWTLNDIEEKFADNCENGLEAPWIPKEKDMPTVCSLGACADGHKCIPCSAETMQCNSGVVCVAPGNINCFEDEPCQNGGQCHQPYFFDSSNKYLCEWAHPDPVVVTVEANTYEGVLTSRNQLTVYGISSLPNTFKIEKHLASATVNITDTFTKDQDIIVPFVSVKWENSTSNVAEKLHTNPLPPKIEQCSAVENFNWYKECNSHSIGKYLLTGGENGLLSGWSGHNILLDDQKLLLSETEKEFTNVTLKIVIDVQESEPGAGLSLTVGGEESFWYVDDEVLPYTDYVATSRLNNLEVLRLTRAFGKIRLKAMFGKKLVVTSIKINNNEQLLSKEAALVSTEREFYKKNGENITNFEAWTFQSDGSASIYRDEHEVHPPTRECTFIDDGEQSKKQCSAESVPTNGIRWPIEASYQKRIHGWTKIKDTDQQTANMIVYNGEFTPIVDAYIYHKRLYVNGERTECEVNAFEWWHWTVDAKEQSKTHFNTGNDEIVINEYVIAGPATTVFNATWSIDVSIGDCHFETHNHVLSIARVMTRHKLMGAHFHDIPEQEEHECLAHCHAHKDCRQWSWTAADKHCFLHSELCSEETCTLGSHSMHGFHSQDIAYFDVFSHSRKTKVTWNYIRAEDIIENPFSCPEVNISSIPTLWQPAFLRDYQYLEFDTTAVCNQMYTTWESLPGYNTYNCEGRECVYNKHDFGDCANYMEYARPNVSAIEGCEEEKEKFADLDWTSYCRYERSFHGAIPFLGGRDIHGGTMETMCAKTYSKIDETQNMCSVGETIDIGWFNNCFGRTEEYENFCHADCLAHIETMLDDQPDDESICKKRATYLKMSDIGLHAECDCTLNNMIITDFCTMQDAYHVGDYVRVPELYNSECSRECSTTLQDAMDKRKWRQWCQDLSGNKIPGTCSKTVCECDTSNIGVAGKRCELSCPTGIDNGEELACSGRNGRCFAQDETEIILSEDKQNIAGEYRDGLIFEAPKMPIWQTGPSPTANGRCQCALGSGLACSIPCERCNNGTYGLDMASQYGICDSFNGICRGLPPWMRFNFEIATDLQIAYNSTAFKSSLGTSVISFPERFMYESDNTLIEQALKYVNDKNGVYLKPAEQSTLDEQDSIKLTLEIFEELCWDESLTNFQYLSNTNTAAQYSNIKLAGLSMNTQHDLRTFTIDASNDCTDIVYDTNLTLCYSEGRMFARDNDRTLIVIERNSPTSSENGDYYINGMTFARHPNDYILTFGGEWDYGDIQTKINTVYKIEVQRFEWQPRDIIILNWHSVSVSGSIPTKQTYSPIYTFLDDMYMLSKMSDESYQLFRLELPTPINEIATWSTIEMTLPIRGNPREIVGNNVGQLYIYFVENTWIYTPDAYTTFVTSTETSDAPVFGQVPKTRVDSYTGTCQLELVRQDKETHFKLGGRTLLRTDLETSLAHIYLEEWNLIDVSTGSDVIQRFAETVRFDLNNIPTNILDRLTQAEKTRAVDLLERVYMHQARWTMSGLMHVKNQIQSSVWDTDSRYEIQEPSSRVYTPGFNSIFDSLSLSYFETDIDTTPTYLNIFFEGSTAHLVIQGNYLEPKIGYTQNFYIGRHKMEVNIEWDAATLRIRLEKANSDGGRVEWFYTKPCQTFLIVLPLEKWLHAVSSKDTETFTNDYGTKTFGRDALFNLFVSSNPMPTHNMMKQTSDFLAYSSSHCSMTAGEKCPGLLPYINIPCSGRGRCNIGCQCVCEVAPSVLASSTDALLNINPEQSPYRGRGCEITCPGFDGYNLDSICSGRGVCQYDGSCSCPQGYTGDSCQFKCPVDEDENICSAHGGCGTKATESSSFVFTGDDYMDTITATNKKNYAMALSEFYGQEHCARENYIEQPAEFNYRLVSTTNGDFIDKFLAIAKCESINYDIRNNADVYRDEEFREYPYGMCIGLQKNVEKFLVVTLLNPEWTKLELLADVESLFECEAAECSFEPSDTNDNSIKGLETNLLTPSFEIKMTYVHGASSGIEHYKVNGLDFYMKTEWTPRAFKLELGFGSTWTVLEYADYIEILKIRIEGNNPVFKVFKGYYPVESPTKTSFLAPHYENKYIPVLESLGRYILIKENVPFFDRNEVEYACDMSLECSGIIQWDEPYKENYFTLYSEMDNVLGFEAYDMIQSPHIFLKKMSGVYQGADTVNGKCDTIVDKRSKYPTVQYEETYDIPIQDIDLSLAKDDETPSINIGSGLWTNCWTKGLSTTKVGCYEEARANNSYGFAFSDVEEPPICLVYYKITDQTKIKLGRYNSEARKTLFNPCHPKNTYWRPTD